MIVGKEYKDKFLPHWEKWKRVTFRGYNYGGIIANELAHLHHVDTEGRNYKLKSEIKTLLKRLCYRNGNIPISVFNQTQNTFDDRIIGFLMDDDNRSDYLKQCKYVLSQLDDYNLRVFSIDKNAKIKQLLSFKCFLNKLIIALKVFFSVPIVRSFKSQSLAKNVKLLSKSLFYYDVIENIKLNKLLKNIDLLIVFSDMKQYGNIFIQSAKGNNILTATLQHGIYIRHKDDQYSQSAINYLNSPADFLLGWGESVVNVFNTNEQISKNILLSGTSVNDYGIGNYYDALNVTASVSSNKFVLLFSRSTLKQSNINMLHIAQTVAFQTGYKFDVLMHPTNKLEHYNFNECANLNKVYQDSSMLLNLIEESDFCICHSTTVYFTSLLKHKACFRYNDSYFIDYGGLDDKFRNYEELLSKIENNAHVLENEKQKKVEALLKYQFGNLEYSYKRSIKELLNQVVKN